jgi:hypothetical protein
MPGKGNIVGAFYHDREITLKQFMKKVISSSLLGSADGQEVLFIRLDVRMVRGKIGQIV